MKTRERSSVENTLGELVRLARRRVERGRAAHPARMRYWQAADDALQAIEDRGGALAGAGAEFATGFLEAWVQEVPWATADEVIESMRQGTRDLEEETRRRRERNEALLSLARELGSAGVRLLLAVLLAA